MCAFPRACLVMLVSHLSFCCLPFYLLPVREFWSEITLHSPFFFSMPCPNVICFGVILISQYIQCGVSTVYEAICISLHSLVQKGRTLVQEYVCSFVRHVF